MESAAQWFRDNASRFTGQLSFDEPLSKHTYYRIGGPADILAIPRSVEDLKWLAEGILHAKAPHFVLGAGSNLLVSDAGFRGLIVKAGRINLELTVKEAGRLRTGASVAVSSLLRRAAHEGWGGLELLTGVPGSVGGAVWMNAGTHLGETASRLKRVEAFALTGPTAGQSAAYEGPALRFEYRKNLFLPAGALVWAAEWEVAHESAAAVKARIDETLARRKATQPAELPSCGSVFKNPRASLRSAWQVIDQLGLRGHRAGDAQISEKHSNFIVNHGGARAADVRALIELAERRARDELGIELEREVIYLGH